MIRESEAARLRQQMAKELEGTWSIFFKCVIGIVIVVTLAIISPTVGLERGTQAETIAAKAAPH
jgi:hypothetical protein